MRAGKALHPQTNTHLSSRLGKQERMWLPRLSWPRLFSVLPVFWGVSAHYLLVRPRPKEFTSVDTVRSRTPPPFLLFSPGPRLELLPQNLRKVPVLLPLPCWSHGKQHPLLHPPVLLPSAPRGPSTQKAQQGCGGRWMVNMESQCGLRGPSTLKFSAPRHLGQSRKLPQRRHHSGGKGRPVYSPGGLGHSLSTL